MSKGFRRIYIGIAVFTIGAIVLGYLIVSTLEAFGRPRPMWAITAGLRRDAERKMHLKFPSSAQIRYYQHPTIGLDDLVFLKLRLPSEDLSQLLEQSALRKAEWEPLWPNGPRLSDDDGWPEWTPSQVKEGSTTQVDLPEFSYLRVLIDETSTTESEVYFMWFTI